MQDNNGNHDETIKPEKTQPFLTSTPFLTNGLFLIGATILLLGILIDGQGLENVPLSLLSITCGLWTISGIFIMLRRELPRPASRSIKGPIAVLTGVIGSLVFGIMEVMILIDIFKSIAGK